MPTAYPKIKKANPECLIVLAGCFPQAFEEEASALDECGIIVGTGAKKEIPALIKRYITSGERIIRIVPRERGEAFEKMTNSGLAFFILWISCRHFESD